jgi:molybdate transport system ATP-binding protein
MTIKCKKVSIKKGDTVVLKNIHFDINKGENWVVLGGNGSGKTTLLNAIVGNEWISKGRISHPKRLHIDLLSSDFKANRLVNQAYQYYQQRYNADDADIAPTVYDIIQNQVKPLYTINEASVALPKKLYKDSTVEMYANILKIKHLLHHKIVTLSNGETRRVHLLDALLKKPNVLLLDNPFVGLDVHSRQTLHTILTDIMTQGIQIVVVCTAAEIPIGITNALILEGGKIANILRGEEVEHLKQNPSQNVPLFDPKMLLKIKKKPQGNNFKYAVRFRNATVQYDGEKVVKDISWDIKKGEKWALLGANGSGKSSILSLITADNPQGYRNDYDLFDRKRGSGESIWDIKKRIGFVSPELHLYANEYNEVWSVIASGLFDSTELYRSLTITEMKTVNTYIKLFGLQKIKNKLLHQISTGQQRLVFLARALVKNPALLILDEPCQGLDYAHMIYFRELVNELVVSLDKTLIYVTHYEEEIPACVNQIFRLDKGKRVLLD